MRCRGIWLVLAWLTVAAWPRSGTPLRATVARDEVVLHWSGAGSISVYRATERLQPEMLKEERLPLAHWEARGESYHDRWLAHGVDYYYLARVGQRWEQAGPVRLRARKLAVSSHPWIAIDKSRYLLSVMEGKTRLKSYPVALGAQPVPRKLCVDFATTPEGRYQIVGLQPQATYYRAYDINYPNATDRARHQILRPDQEIGGEIQIHGQGVGRNWTWGCVALRNQDIDELFAHRELGVGTPVWIYGGEVTLTQLERDARAGPVDRLRLGRRQQSQGLPVTCLAP